jgi:hypothetical protein
MHTLGNYRAWRILIAVLWLLLPAHALTQPVKEYELKAALLFNFLQFVEWPADAFAPGDSPIVVGVLGDDPFGPPLDQLVQDAAVNNRKIVVRRYARAEDIDVCHMLFVNVRPGTRLKSVFEALGSRAILTVGDAEGFLEQGGMIQFVTQNARVRLRINLDIAKAAGLTLSSKLLRPAQIVTTAAR